MTPRSIRPPRSLLAVALLAVVGMAMPREVRADFLTPVGWAQGTGGNMDAQVLMSTDGGTTYSRDVLTGLFNLNLVLGSNPSGPAINYNGYCLSPLNNISFGVQYGNVTTTSVPPSPTDLPLAGQMLYIAHQNVNSTDGNLQVATALVEAALAIGSSFKYEFVGSDNSDINATAVQADYNAMLSHFIPFASGTVEDAGPDNGGYPQSMTGVPPSLLPPSPSLLPSYCLEWALQVSGAGDGVAENGVRGKCRPLDSRNWPIGLCERKGNITQLATSGAHLFPSKENLMRSLLVQTCGLLLVFVSMASMARADIPVPEIDPGSMSSALTLLAGGALILTERLRRK